MEKIAIIVDDDRSERRMIISVLRNNIDLNFRQAENGKEALRILQKSNADDIALIVLDLDMPVMGGMEALEIIAKKYPFIPVIILTGNTENNNIVKAMKMGAADFLSKPVEHARLDVSARNALKMSLMSREITRLKRRRDDVVHFSDLVGHEEGLKESILAGHKAALCDLPVLITGRTGTGKEIFARAIHGESSRTSQNFITVNCGAIPEKLVESTLFGHEKGSFTGATHKAPGKFLEASGGTIFLDEIGELPLDAQVKFLRVLQQGEVEPVGASKAAKVDVRVISATNRDLAKEVKEGRFREDLYFRLNVLDIELPSLNKRKEDIPAMIEYFIKQFCATHGYLPKNISSEAITKLQTHNWLGNVRELQNVINRAMAMCDDNYLDIKHFSFVEDIYNKLHPLPKYCCNNNSISTTNKDGSFKSYKQLEGEIVAMALAHHDGNMSKTARVLGIAKSTLYAKINNITAQQSP